MATDQGWPPPPLASHPPDFSSSFSSPIRSTRGRETEHRTRGAVAVTYGRPSVAKPHSEGQWRIGCFLFWLSEASGPSMLVVLSFKESIAHTGSIPLDRFCPLVWSLKVFIIQQAGQGSLASCRIPAADCLLWFGHIPPITVPKTISAMEQQLDKLLDKTWGKL